MRQETIENYLKTIYHLSTGNSQVVTNQKLAEKLNINPASVTEALRKLDELKYVVYEKSYGTRLTASGSRLALTIIRRHRLWETFLANQLGFGWEEVHEIAEALEHVDNEKLISRLSELLGHPTADPHGDPIPDERGKFRKTKHFPLSQSTEGMSLEITGVTDHSTAFLKFLEKNKLVIGAQIHVKAVEEFDGSVLVTCQKREVVITRKAAEHLVVAKR